MSKEEQQGNEAQRARYPEGTVEVGLVVGDKGIAVPLEPTLMLSRTVEELEYYLAYIQGSREPTTATLAGNARLLSGLMSRRAFSSSSLFLGPIFWAYRKCYLEALILIGVCLSTFLFGLSYNTKVFRAMPLFIAGFVFYPLYRRRAQAALRKAWEQGITEPDEVKAWMRQKGGTSFVGAVIATIAYGMIALAFLISLVGVRLDMLSAVF